MSPIVQAIPDVDVLLSFEPEELGAKLLFIAKQDRDMFSLIGFEQGIWEADMRGRPIYPRHRRAAVALALAEIILLANHLLRIVDSRAKAKGGKL